jgi:hypothetical protein
VAGQHRKNLVVIQRLGMNLRHDMRRIRQ